MPTVRVFVWLVMFLISVGVLATGVSISWLAAALGGAGTTVVAGLILIGNEWLCEEDPDDEIPIAPRDDHYVTRKPDGSFAAKPEIHPLHAPETGESGA